MSLALTSPSADRSASVSAPAISGCVSGRVARADFTVERNVPGAATRRD